MEPKIGPQDTDAPTSPTLLNGWTNGKNLNAPF